MKKNRLMRTTFLLLTLLFLSTNVRAQDDEGPEAPPVEAPIDSWIPVLAIAGAAYLLRVIQTRNTKSST